MEENQKTEKVDYAVLRHQLKLLAKEFNSCESFMLQIDGIDSSLSFKRFLNRNIESIGDRLDIDFPDSDNVEDLEDEISDLKDERDELEEELDDLKERFGVFNNNSLYEQYKYEYFTQYKDFYTAWEIEDLLSNGRIYLSKHLKTA